MQLEKGPGDKLSAFKYCYSTSLLSMLLTEALSWMDYLLPLASVSSPVDLRVWDKKDL